MKIRKTLLAIGLVIMGLFPVIGKEKKLMAGDITLMVIDEKNKPVSNYFVSLEKGKNNAFTGFTNEKGLLTFSEIKFGNYKIYGNKNSYTTLDVSMTLEDSEKVYVVAVESGEVAVVRAGLYLSHEDFAGALKILESIKFEEGSEEKIMIDEMINMTKSYCEMLAIEGLEGESVPKEVIENELQEIIGN